MGLFDDVNRFFEERLDEFLRNHPHLELQALEEQLREQEQDTLRLITDLQLEEKGLQDEILSLAQEIQLWHKRVNKAKDAHRNDLAQAAQEREAALLRQGNQRWGQMEGVKQRLLQSKKLLHQCQQKRKEVQAQAAAAQAARSSAPGNSSSETFGWTQGYNPSSYSSKADPLEQKFQNWETQAELEEMKRNLGK